MCRSVCVFSSHGCFQVCTRALLCMCTISWLWDGICQQMCRHVHTHCWLSIRVRPPVCVQQMKAGRGVLLLDPLIGSIQTETWPSQQMSVRLPKSPHNTAPHSSALFLLLPLTVCVFLGVSLCLFLPGLIMCVPCVTMTGSPKLHDESLRFQIWQASIKWLVFNWKRKMKHGGRCAALSFSPLFHNSSRAKHKACMERVFHILTWLLVAVRAKDVLIRFYWYWCHYLLCLSVWFWADFLTLLV